MKRTLEELKAEVEYWQAERQRIDARFTEARQRLWNAEEEGRRNERPTPAHMAMLKRLANGGTLKTARDFQGRTIYWWVTDDGEGNTSRKVYDGLLHRQLIQHAGKDGHVILYTISDWGREVLARSR
jgi:hypothetical protein